MQQRIISHMLSLECAFHGLLFYKWFQLKVMLDGNPCSIMENEYVVKVKRSTV